MKQQKQQSVSLFIILIILITLLGLSVCFFVINYNIAPAKINIPDYLIISKDDTGLYQYSLDVDRIRYDFCFPESYDLPENIAIDSLSLIVSPAGDSIRFEVGSYLENAAEMLSSGGYALSNTMWIWNDSEILNQYAIGLTVKKNISFKEYVHFRSDGNYNWIPYIDYASLYASIGDRILYDSSLQDVLKSLTVTITACSDYSYKAETWSSFSSPAGLSIESVLQSCGVKLSDTVFIISRNEIITRENHPLSIKAYCIVSYSGSHLIVEIDKDRILSDLGFDKGSAAEEAIQALCVSAEKNGSMYRVSVYSSITDLDIVKILYDNGVSLQDTYFEISETNN